jgi:tRNA-dihydrouridine synthase
MITVHGRTRNDFYTGTANWSAVRAVKEATSLPVLVNGDIVDEVTAREALKQSGADGVMLGRAATGRPWLPGAVAKALESGEPMIAPPLEVQRDAAITHYKETIGHYGAPLGVRMARKHLAAAVDHAGVDIDPMQRKALRSEICRMASPERVSEELAAFFEGEFDVAEKSAA